MDKLIRSEIIEIQREYLQLLQNSMKHFNSSNSACAIDNLLIFWHSHRRVISLFLNSFDPSSRAYLFAGASYLNTKDNNHYPFVSLGDIHIVDDPLCKFARAFPGIMSMQKEGFYSDFIINAANDIIDIIKKYNDFILIIPVTFGFHEDDQKINEVSTKKFLHLFRKNFTSLKEYLSEIVTIEDVYSALKDECKNYLPMSDATPIEDGLITCFNEFKKTFPFCDQKNNSDSFLFYMHTHGMLAQSLDIILCCMKFNLVPYIRSQTCFYYTATAVSNILEISAIKDVYFRMTCAYMLYRYFPAEFDSIDFEKYCKTVMAYDIDLRLNPLLSRYLETSQLSLSEVQAELLTCFDQLAKSLNISSS